MKKILLIDNNRAVPLNETRFTEELKLQDYLEEYPALIPLAEVVDNAPDILCIGREVSAGIGSIDLLCIDKDGLLTIIETKLRKNTEARREVVAQVIEYASYASQWTADNVYNIANDYFNNTKNASHSYIGKSLDKIIEGIVGEAFNNDEFKLNIERNLQDGRIRLIIAVDKLVEQLRSIVTFLNKNSSFDILILQISDFTENESRKVLIPTLFGYTATTAQKASRIWDEQSFITEMQNKRGSEEVAITKSILAWTKRKNLRIWWGKGKTYGTFLPMFDYNGIPYWTISVNTLGGIQIQFGMISKEAPFNDEQYLLEFLARLNEIEGVNLAKETITRYPSFPIILLNTKEAFSKFLAIFDWQIEQIESYKNCNS